MTSVPILHTDRCTLSAIKQSDIPVLREILDDADTQRFLPELCEEFQTAESLQQFIASFDKFLLQNEGILWGIRKNISLIGFIAIMDLSDNPTLFYAMHPAYRLQGYMKESLIEAILFIGYTSLCCTLQTEVYRDNVISQRLLTSLGFRQYKTKKQKIIFKINIH